ncbi:MAG: HTTM domain-containing protein [Bacteroidota bacterium]
MNKKEVIGDIQKDVPVMARLFAYLEQPVSIAPLVTFRIAFGLVMLFSTLRYIWMGWVDTQLVEPILHFSYYSFDWIQPLSRTGMYAIFFVMAITCIGIALGAFYRVSTVLFFLCFTYVELIDITYYLNHYYFVSIVAFLLILVPANRYFSFDTLRNPSLTQKSVSRWCILIFKLQIAIVYTYAGLAKINHDWLFRALPLKIWLPAKTSLPLIGWIFKYELTAYLFSWMGMLFDTFIILFLVIRKTRILAYLAVVFFHAMTGILFQIGVFPLVMILVVTIFFSSEWHERWMRKVSSHWQGLRPLTGLFSRPKNSIPTPSRMNKTPVETPHWGVLGNKVIAPFLLLFFLFQLLFPWRYLLYVDNNLFWTEEGYRFSWRVMLMEKAGTATFYVKDGKTGREGAVRNSDFLNPHQEKQMPMQPDLILQYAHYLKDHYTQQGMQNPSVRAEAWVTLNGLPAQLLVDPTVDLTQKTDRWTPKDWILPLKPPQN